MIVWRWDEGAEKPAVRGDTISYIRYAAWRAAGKPDARCQLAANGARALSLMALPSSSMHCYPSLPSIHEMGLGGARVDAAPHPTVLPCLPSAFICHLRHSSLPDGSEEYRQGLLLTVIYSCLFNYQEVLCLAGLKIAGKSMEMSFEQVIQGWAESLAEGSPERGFTKALNRQKPEPGQPSKKFHHLRRFLRK